MFNVTCHRDRTGDTREPAWKFKETTKWQNGWERERFIQNVRVFNQKWTSDYFFVQWKEVAVCLICQETVSVFKEYNLRRHETHHREKYASLQGQMRANKVSKLKSVLSTQQNIFVRQTQLNQSSVRASFQVAKLIATSGRPFSNGEFVKKCMKKDILNAVSLSANTITRRIEEMGDNVYAQLQEKVKEFDFLGLAQDESNDVQDTAQLIIFLLS